MAVVFAIIFTFAACYVPALAQSRSGYVGATGTANAVSTGGSAVANACASSTVGSAVSNSYSYSYSNSNGNVGVRDCTYNRCTPTCSVPIPPNCPKNSNPCNCPKGMIISQEGGQCVHLEQCQSYINCKGDYHAQPSNCPDPCPATCANPNDRICHTRDCIPGCECKSGYILSAVNGKCIKPEQCPGGYVCGRNETFLNCVTDCPSLYCPVDSVRVACGPQAPPCPGGCACKYNYLRKSVNDHTCILASDCPPGKCYGPNEEWSRCVPLCYSDKCKDRNKVPKPSDCPFSPNECYPGCICRRGFYRNKFTCVPAHECPSDNQ